MLSCPSYGGAPDWVWPAAGGLGLALIVLDVFVRGPIRFLFVGAVARLVYAVQGRRW